LVHFVEKHRDAVPLVYSSADPATVKAAQSRYGTEPLAHAIETLFSDLAGALAARGFTRIVSAGGETSGAVVRGLDIEALQIGPEIDPGVPAMRVTGKPLAVALKSGNFGAEDFFDKAVMALGAQT
jgi:3-dehydrotetronate 4-kinase